MDTLTTPPVVMGTTLAVLAPYLPYGIEVETGIDDGERERMQLHSLTQDGYPRVRLYGCEKAASFTDMLPVLYGFDALPYVLAETPWGMTPASVILARMIAGMQFMPENVKANPTSIWAQDYTGGSFKSVLFADTVERGRLMLSVAEWLRSQHFAVGLEPHQYIAK